jgi:hypothetical protein
LPVLVPIFPAAASLDDEVFVTLADPPRAPLPGIEPRVLRPGVARYAGQRLACKRVSLASGRVGQPGPRHHPPR